MKLSWFAFVLAAAVFAAPGALLDTVKEKAPGPKAKGVIFQWKSKDGPVYHYRIPKNYSDEKGANLTFILHGSNLDRRWGFANHSYKTFRADDIVVSPDGTTSNGSGGFNFLNRGKDLKQLKKLHEELKKIFWIRATFLYGHSQGSFFSFLYAGEYPDSVQGVVGHASGVWASTKKRKQCHGQAIVLMHGTEDPVVPCVQSADGYKFYQDAKYPFVRLRRLEGWNHWPAEHNGPVAHTSQQLAWCEGMTTEDLSRLEESFDFIASCKQKERTDYGAIYTLAMHIKNLDEAPPALKARASKAMTTINALAAKHVTALKAANPAKFNGNAWIGHMPMFLRTFMSVPAREEFASKWKKELARHSKDGGKYYGKYWQALDKGNNKDAFEEGVAAVKHAFLYQRVTEYLFLKELAGLEANSKKLRISKGSLKDYNAIIPVLKKAKEKGAKEFDTINRKCGKL